MARTMYRCLVRVSFMIRDRFRFGVGLRLR
jgi:hypothetical protein